MITVQKFTGAPDTPLNAYRYTKHTTVAASVHKINHTPPAVRNTAEAMVNADSIVGHASGALVVAVTAVAATGSAAMMSRSLMAPTVAIPSHEMTMLP